MKRYEIHPRANGVEVHVLEDGHEPRALPPLFFHSFPYPAFALGPHDGGTYDLARSIVGDALELRDPPEYLYYSVKRRLLDNVPKGKASTITEREIRKILTTEVPHR